jgi:hypothetical protein
MSQMSPGARRHLRKVGRERDSGQTHATFHLAQAEEDITEAKENSEAAIKAKEKAAERQALLEAFNPTLNLKQLQETGSKGYTAKQIQQQIRWHRSIGKDAHLPTGVGKFKKAAAWIVMVRAVRRHLRRTSADEGISFITHKQCEH